MAYSKFIALLEGQAFQQQVGIIPVNPAYTSCLGKVKYMKQLGTSIHIAAAYVIGRRGMKLRERLPKRLRLLHYRRYKKSCKIANCNCQPFSAYSAVYKHIKNAPVKFWYTKQSSKDWKNWKNMETDIKEYNDSLLPNLDVA